MGEAAAYAYLAMRDAISDAGLEKHEVSNERTGIIAGSGGGFMLNQVEAADFLRQKGIRRVGPYRVTSTMASIVSACLATPFEIKGTNYSIASACSTSAHRIGNASELIQPGKQDRVFAGGGEEEHWSRSCPFDAMGALSTKYKDDPSRASRTYDANRDGFVFAGGGGMVVVEELEAARARGAKIYAEVVDCGAGLTGLLRTDEPDACVQADSLASRTGSSRRHPPSCVPVMDEPAWRSTPREPSSLQYEIGRPLGDHHAWRRGVAAHDARHYRGVGDT